MQNAEEGKEEEEEEDRKSRIIEEYNKKMEQKTQKY